MSVDFSRRDFLKASGLTAAAAAFTTCVATQKIPTADACGLDKLLAMSQKNDGTIDGTPIVVTTPVESVKKLKTAKVDQYCDVDTMRVVKVHEGVFHLDESAATNPAGLDPMNNCASMYLLVGKKTAALIDAGNGEASNTFFKNAAMKEIVEGLVEERELKVILTHNHWDHIGLLVDENGYDVIPKDTPVYIGENDLDSLAAKVKERYQVLPLADGDKIEAGGRTLDIVNLPGHTDGSLLMIDYKDEIIFSGDTIGSGTVWLLSDHNLKDYNFSIRRCAAIVANMKDPVFYAGHRWQQYEAVASAASVCVEEMGKEYVVEMVDLMNKIKKDDYLVRKDYIGDPTNENLTMYTDYDRNDDGIVPGIYATMAAAKGFVPNV